MALGRSCNGIGLCGLALFYKRSQQRVAAYLGVVAVCGISLCRRGKSLIFLFKNRYFLDRAGTDLAGRDNARAENLFRRKTRTCRTA